MKKAVIVSGGKQHLVAEGDEIVVNLLDTSDKKTVTFTPIMIVDGKDSVVGDPEVGGVSVSATIVDADSQADKVMSIRYKSKKRVHTVRGHRQRETKLKITSIK